MSNLEKLFSIYLKKQGFKIIKISQNKLILKNF